MEQIWATVVRPGLIGRAPGWSRRLSQLRQAIGKPATLDAGAGGVNHDIASPQGLL